jgi:hypothetical protein
VDRYSFDVENSHLLLHAGLSRRSQCSSSSRSVGPQSSALAAGELVREREGERAEHQDVLVLQTEAVTEVLV